MTNTSRPAPLPSPLARWWGHAWLDARSVKRRLPPAAVQRLEAAVRESESRHRGELRLCIEGGLGPMRPGRAVSPRARAIELFSLLRVWDTAQNNGVLIYLLLAEHRIEVLADRGLADKVPPETWSTLADSLGQALRGGQWEAGLLHAVNTVGDLLRAHYPRIEGDADDNELPDAVVIL